MGDRFYANVRTVSASLLTTWIRVAVTGLEHLPRSGPVLLVANHASFLDPAVLGRACPRKVHFLISKQVYETRGLRWFFRRMDSIPVSLETADSSALRAGLRRLSRGEVVGIFPEGARSVDGELLPAKVGAAMLATRSESPVVPVGIRGAFQSMPVGAAFPRPGQIRVRFGTPFQLAKLRGLGTRAGLEDASRRIMEEISDLVRGGNRDNAVEVGA